MGDTTEAGGFVSIEVDALTQTLIVMFEGLAPAALYLLVGMAVIHAGIHHRAHDLSVSSPYQGRKSA